MTYTDLTAKLTWFAKNPHRLQEPHEGTTAWLYLCKIVWDYWDEQVGRYMQDDWIEETDMVHKKMSRLMKEVE